MSNTTLTVPLPEKLSAEQVLALYDFCQALSQMLWDDHKDVLLELMIEQDRRNGHGPPIERCTDTLELPFEDLEPF